MEENSKKLKYENTAVFRVDRETLWNDIAHLGKILSLMELSGQGRLTETDGVKRGDVTVEGRPVRVKITPYDCEFWIEGARLGVRFYDLGERGCRAYCLAVAKDEKTYELCGRLVERFLRGMTEEADRLKTSARKAESLRRNLDRPQRVRTERPEHPQAERTARPQTERPARPQNPAAAAAAAELTGRREQPAKSRKPRLNRKGIVLIVITAIFLVLAIAGGIRLVHRLREIHSDGRNTKPISGSAVIEDKLEESAVDLVSAEQLQAGMSKSDVERILGTEGSKQKDGSVIYSSAFGRDEYPQYQVRVVYDGTEAVSILFADRTAGAAINEDEKVDYGAKIKYSEVPSEIAEQVGLPVSMFKRTADTISVGFGYYDPYATFSEKWLPEVSYDIDLAEKTGGLNYIWNYVSTMPYVVPDLASSPMAHQYTDLDAQLSDMYIYMRATRLMEDPSYGDAKRFLGGSLKRYDSYATMAMRHLVEEEPSAVLEDGSPAYAVSVSVMNKLIQGSAYTNLRIYRQSGMLEGTGYKRVTRGMTFSEVEQLMGILPSAFYYDGEYICYCYGEYIETDVFEEQFEYIVRVAKDSGIVVNIYDNSGVIGGLVKSDDYEPVPDIEDAMAQDAAANG